MAQILLYVDGADGAGVWTEVGTTPFLNVQDQPINYIYSISRNSNSDNFSFENTALSGTINSVKLYIHAYGVASNNFTSILSGVDTGLGPPVSWGLVNIDVSDILTNWDLINAATILFDRPNTTNEAGIDVAYLLVDYTEDIEEKYGIAVVSGNGSLNVIGQKKISALITISENGSLSSVRVKNAFTIVLISGNGSIFIVGSMGLFGSVEITENGSLIIEGIKQARSPPFVSGNGTIEVVGVKKVSLSVLISSNGLVSLVGIKKSFEIVSISGNGNITVIGVVGLEEKFGTAQISGNGDIRVVGMKAASTGIFISDNGSLITTRLKKAFDIATISGNGLITILSQVNRTGTILISNNGNLIIVGFKKALKIISISGSGSLNVNFSKDAFIDILISGNGNISVIGSSGEEEPKEGTVQISGNGIIKLLGIKNAEVSILISNVTDINVAGFKSIDNQIKISEGGSIYTKYLKVISYIPLIVDVFIEERKPELSIIRRQVIIKMQERKPKLEIEK